MQDTGKMSERIVIPVEEKGGIESRIAQHFGRAPFFAIVDLDEMGDISKVEIQPNTGEHAGGAGHPHEILLALKPNVVVAYGIGPGGLQSFRNARIRVLKAEAPTVKEAIASFKEGTLQELTGGCEHAHHHEHAHHYEHYSHV